MPQIPVFKNDINLFHKMSCNRGLAGT